MSEKIAKKMEMIQNLRGVDVMEQILHKFVGANLWQKRFNDVDDLSCCEYLVFHDGDNDDDETVGWL